MEHKDIPNKSREILKDNYLPTVPTPEGEWKDKQRDHSAFQLKVPLAARLGGVSSTAGCLHEGADAARKAAQERYYRSQEIHPKTINKEK